MTTLDPPKPKALPLGPRDNRPQGGGKWKVERQRGKPY